MGATYKGRLQTVMINLRMSSWAWSVCTSVNKKFPFCLLKCYFISKPTGASGSSYGYLALCFRFKLHRVRYHDVSPPAYSARSVETGRILQKSICLSLYVINVCMLRMHICMHVSVSNF